MQHRNTFTGGMKNGVDFSMFPQDSYTYMLNGCIISKDEHGFMVTNVKGHTKIHEFGLDEFPIGSTTFNGILYIITHKIVATVETICFYSMQHSNGTTWVDGIGTLWNGNTSSPLEISQSVLGFSRDKLLDVFSKESYDGSVDLYICNGLNPNIIINTGLNREGELTNRFYSNLTTPSLFFMQKTVNRVPTVNFTVRKGGNLKPGTYYAYIRYEDESLNTTPFIKEVGPIFIHSGASSNSTASGVLNEDNARIDKQILLDITDTDTNYKKVSIGIVFYFGLNDVVSRENYLIDKSYTLVNGAIKVIINGDNKTQSLLVEDLLKDNLRYDTSETHTQLDNRYFGANWKSKDIDMSVLRTLASKFIPRAIIKDYTDLDYANEFNQVCDENTKDFEYMEDEIYPLGVSFLIDGQYKTDVFPMFGWYENKAVMKAIYEPVYDYSLAVIRPFVGVQEWVNVFEYSFDVNPANFIQMQYDPDAYVNVYEYSFTPTNYQLMQYNY